MDSDVDVAVARTGLLRVAQARFGDDLGPHRDLIFDEPFHNLAAAKNDLSRSRSCRIAISHLYFFAPSGPVRRIGPLFEAEELCPEGR
jgi:hypothetical protein